MNTYTDTYTPSNRIPAKLRLRLFPARNLKPPDSAFLDAWNSQPSTLKIQTIARRAFLNGFNFDQVSELLDEYSIKNGIPNDHEDAVRHADQYTKEARERWQLRAVGKKLSLPSHAVRESILAALGAAFPRPLSVIQITRHIAEQSDWVPDAKVTRLVKKSIERIMKDPGKLGVRVVRTGHGLYALESNQETAKVLDRQVCIEMAESFRATVFVPRHAPTVRCMRDGRLTEVPAKLPNGSMDMRITEYYSLWRHGEEKFLRKHPQYKSVAWSGIRREKSGRFEDWYHDPATYIEPANEPEVLESDPNGSIEDQFFRQWQRREWTSAAELYAVYVEFCHQQPVEPVSATRFAVECKSQHLIPVRRRVNGKLVRGYEGVTG
jgi:hypothetical protein